MGFTNDFDIAINVFCLTGGYTACYCCHRMWSGRWRFDDVETNCGKLLWLMCLLIFVLILVMLHGKQCENRISMVRWTCDAIFFLWYAFIRSVMPCCLPCNLSNSRRCWMVDWNFVRTLAGCLVDCLYSILTLGLFCWQCDWITWSMRRTCRNDSLHGPNFVIYNLLVKLCIFYLH